MNSEVKVGDKQTLKKKKTLPKQNSCWRHKPKPILLSDSAAKGLPFSPVLTYCSDTEKQILICVNENSEKYKEKKK